jgi:hypothetical protein
MRQTAKKRATSNASNDVAPNCAEELAALRAIVDGTAHGKVDRSRTNGKWC